MQLETFIPLTNLFESIGLSEQEAYTAACQSKGIPGVFVEAGNLRSAIGRLWDKGKDAARTTSDAGGKYFDTKAHNAANAPMAVYNDDGVLKFIIYKDLDLSRPGHKEVLQAMLQGLQAKYGEVKLPPINDPLRQSAAKANTTVFAMPDNDQKDKLVDILTGLDTEVQNRLKEFKSVNYVAPLELQNIQQELARTIGYVNQAAEAAAAEATTDTRQAVAAQTGAAEGKPTEQPLPVKNTAAPEPASLPVNNFMSTPGKLLAQPATTPKLPTNVPQAVAPAPTAPAVEQPAVQQATANTIAANTATVPTIPPGMPEYTTNDLYGKPVNPKPVAKYTNPYQAATSQPAASFTMQGSNMSGKPGQFLNTLNAQGTNFTNAPDSHAATVNAVGGNPTYNMAPSQVTPESDISANSENKTEVPLTPVASAPDVNATPEYTANDLFGKNVRAKPNRVSAARAANAEAQPVVRVRPTKTKK